MTDISRQINLAGVVDRLSAELAQKISRVAMLEQALEDTMAQAEELQKQNDELQIKNRDLESRSEPTEGAISGG